MFHTKMLSILVEMSPKPNNLADNFHPFQFIPLSHIHPIEWIALLNSIFRLYHESDSMLITKTTTMTLKMKMKMKKSSTSKQ